MAEPYPFFIKNVTSGITYYYKVRAVYDANSKMKFKPSGYKSGKKVNADAALAEAIKKTVKTANSTQNSYFGSPKYLTCK